MTTYLRGRRSVPAITACLVAFGSVAAVGQSADPSVAQMPRVVPSGSLNGLALDDEGRLFAADCFSARIFRFDADGPVVVAGNGRQDYSGDGGSATEASLYCPFGPAFDERGMFIADHGNNRLRLVDASGVITTFAGTGPAGIDQGALEGDGGPAIDARFQEPSGIAIDEAGVIYVGDRDNHVVRRIDTNGIITTIAGTGMPGFGGDGGAATEALLNGPGPVVVDDAGNVDFVDAGNARVRQIRPDGTITTLAGNGKSTSSGDGGPATDASIDVEGLALDIDGDLYIADRHRIRRVDTAGVISTIAGTGIPGVAGDDGPAVDAQLRDPAALVIGQDGTLFVSSDGIEPACVRAISTDGIIRRVWCGS